MTRQLRIEFKGAVYHITERGNVRQAIFLTEKDFADFSRVLCSVVKRYHFILAYSRFLKKAKIDNNLDCKQLLSNLGFFKNNKLNYSGILLFSKDITKYLRNATIQCVLYQGTSSTIIDKKEFSKDLLSNFEDAIKYIKSKLNTEYVIKST